MVEIVRRARDGRLTAAVAKYGMYAALISLVCLGSVTVAGANVNVVLTNFVHWVAASG